MAREVDYRGIAAYVDKRRKTTGGYGATPRLPATIEDSFEAVAIADDLAVMAPGNGLPYPPSADGYLQRYLQQTMLREWPGLRTTWQLLFTGKRLGLAVDRDRAHDYLRRQRAEPPDLSTAYYTSSIAAELGLPPASPKAAEGITLPDRLTVAEARLFLALQKLSGANLATDFAELIPWLRRCQNGDGGFGFFPGTTSFVENCHHTLAALQLLGATPAAPEAARRFLLSCQTGTGGFGRNLRAAPFLDATWHGLAAIKLLG